jgi:hypothetical protein
VYRASELSRWRGGLYRVFEERLFFAGARLFLRRVVTCCLPSLYFSTRLGSCHGSVDEMAIENPYQRINDETPEICRQSPTYLIARRPDVLDVYVIMLAWRLGARSRFRENRMSSPNYAPIACEQARSLVCRFRLTYVSRYRFAGCAQHG